MSDSASASQNRRQPRRHDPQRRNRIIDVTLDVIAEHGVSGTTYRRIAEAADVSLGSITYYFTSADELIGEAFTRLAEQISADFSRQFTGVRDRDDALQAVINIIDGRIWGTPRTLLLSYELYAFSSRHTRFRHLPRYWMKLSRATLEQHFPPATARALDALIEGIGIHNSMDEQPVSREEISRLVLLIAQN